VNADAAELAKFASLAHQYWDPAGPLRTLHALNPVRAGYVAARIGMASARVADVGCGGGLLAEAMARGGARVTAIDLEPGMIDVARLHAATAGLAIDYRNESCGALADREPGAFDAVCCMELIEHVPDPAALVADLAALLRPGGSLVISTISRTLRAFLGAIVAAEYVLGLVPRGTHQYARLLRPAELAAAARAAGLELVDLKGLHYDPFTHRASISDDTQVNYIAHFRRPASP
jgi:2-polyprenyl-6-hydroxyphenyl methylase/3-demethylubiquinone-9 3-methyltransferase